MMDGRGKPPKAVGLSFSALRYCNMHPHLPNLLIFYLMKFSVLVLPMLSFTAHQFIVIFYSTQGPLPPPHAIAQVAATAALLTAVSRKPWMYEYTRTPTSTTSADRVALQHDTTIKSNGIGQRRAARRRNTNNIDNCAVTSLSSLPIAVWRS